MIVRYSYLLGPALALAAVGVLALILRWIYSDSTPAHRASSGPADYGLLVPVTAVPDAAAAARLRAVLGEHGIRATRTSGPAGTVLVLVFPADAERARALLAPTE